ncbi:MAG: hypothetical protein K0R57_1058 [Paenibacillaceae bacterium]|nr:hypothetical protein [Paenibacillaceae bacterium]
MALELVDNNLNIDSIPWFARPKHVMLTGSYITPLKDGWENMDDWNEGMHRVQNYLNDKGLNRQVVLLPDSARTAAAAAEAIGCSVAQIAKSIIFRLPETGEALLVITSGINRVNEKTVAQTLGVTLGKADAEFVREKTGYAIGGVAPVAHKEQVRTLIDRDLLQYEEIWAAAGHPKSVFPLSPDELLAITESRVLEVK